MSVPRTPDSLTVDEAISRIVAAVTPLDVENVGLSDSLGRVLGEDVVSPVTLPPWNNSAMDGYAIRCEDLLAQPSGSPVEFDVVGSVFAGKFPDRPLEMGEAVRVMTGAPVPQGTDTVIRIEDTDRGVERVTVLDWRDIGRNVRPKGEDFKAGDTVLKKGMLIAAPQIGLLSAVGQSSVAVYRRPRVAIAGSGDELVELDQFAQVLSGEKIVSSNSYALEAAVRDAGGVSVFAAHSGDNVDAIRATVERALDAEPDLLITSAGVSVGESDLTWNALETLGGTIDFWRVRMRPGSPICFGSVAGVPWIGLPGNPVSALVTFELFARPAIRKLSGLSALHRRRVDVTAESEISISAPLTHFLRAIVSEQDGLLTARLTGAQGSGVMRSMSDANALLIIPPDATSIPAGSVVKAILISDGIDFAP